MPIQTKTKGACRLCKQERYLQNSHLLPKALYKIVRDQNSSDSNPVLVTKETSWQTSRQLSAFLLCKDCETLFNKNGENYTLMNCCRSDTHFPLRDILKTATPIDQRGKIKILSGATIHSLDIHQLIYFASSVFWRASAHSWHLDGHQFTPISLGITYEEQFRQFLLGASQFPSNAVIWISVSSAPSPLRATYDPNGGRYDNYHMYNFAIPGLLFILYLGKQLPSNIRDLCSFRSARKLIYFTEEVERVTMSSFFKLMTTSKPSRKLST